MEKSHKWQQKRRLEVEWLRPGRVPLPVHHWEALWIATEAPRVRLCGIWMLPKVIATSCQVLAGRQANPPHPPSPRLREMSTKLQTKGHIHGNTKRWKLDGTEGIMLHWIHKVGGEGGSQDACFTFQEKGHTTVTPEGGNTVSLCSNLSFCHSIPSALQSELKTL